MFIVDSFDYILIDCPAGIEQGFKNAIAAANEAIFSQYFNSGTYPEIQPLAIYEQIRYLSRLF